MNPFLLALLIYGLLLAGLGVFLARYVSHSRDFFVAGRDLGAGLLFSTILAANIGAGSTVGAAGLGYRLGLSAWWWVGSFAIGSLVLAFWVGPRIRDLAEQQQFLTVGDFLEARYSRTVRALASSLLWLASLMILAGQLIAMAWILGVVAGTGKAAGCALGGVIVTVYFAAGGLRGTAWINLFQLLVKGAGFLLAAPVLYFGIVGGWAGLQSRLPASNQEVENYFALTGMGLEGVLAYLVMLAPAFVVSPGLLQKVYGARDASAVRRGVGANAAVLLVYAFVPVFFGMTAAAFFPGLENPELALPRVMTELVPFWLGALLLAAVFSAEISSADAVLFMLSTSLSRDLYQTYFRPELSETQLLGLARMVAAAAGAVAIGLAIVLPSVIAALSIFYVVISVVFFAPVLLGLYGRPPAARLCLAAIVISTAGTAAFYFVTGGDGIGVISPVAAGILISLLVMLAPKLRSAT